MSDDSQSDNIVSNPRPWLDLKSKQKIWLKAFLDDSNPATFMNKAGSAKFAKYNGKDQNSFNCIGSQNYIKLRPRIEQWMDDHGFTKKTNSKKLLQLSEAQETKVITVEGRINPESLPDNFTIVTESVQEKYTKDGDSYEQIKTVISYTLAANETQRRTTDMMIKVLGQYAADEVKVTGLDKLADRLIRANKRVGNDDKD